MARKSHNKRHKGRGRGRRGGALAPLQSGAYPDVEMSGSNWNNSGYKPFIQQVTGGSSGAAASAAMNRYAMEGAGQSGSQSGGSSRRRRKSKIGTRRRRGGAVIPPAAAPAPVMKAGSPPAPAPAAPAPAAPAPAAPAPEPSKIITPSTGSTKSLSQLVSIQSDTTIVGLNQTLVDRMTAMTEAFKEQTGKKIFVTSGYRSNEEQKELYDRWVQGGKKNKIVSKPKAPLKGIDGLSGAGSPHSSGTAIDVNSKGDGGINVLAGPADKSTGWLEKFGLTRPVYPPDFKINGKPIDKSKQEDWHIVAMGSKPGSPDGGIIPSSGGATIDPSTGKQSGKQLAAASTEVAVNQREQEKRQTPTVINAGITNNNTNIRNTSRAEAKAA